MSSRRHLTALLSLLVLATAACDDAAPVILGRRVPTRVADAGESVDADFFDARISEREREHEEAERAEHEREEEEH
jgi:hypothetical protein